MVKDKGGRFEKSLNIRIYYSHSLDLKIKFFDNHVHSLTELPFEYRAKDTADPVYLILQGTFLEFRTKEITIPTAVCTETGLQKNQSSKFCPMLFSFFVSLQFCATAKLLWNIFFLYRNIKSFPRHNKTNIKWRQIQLLFANSAIALELLSVTYKVLLNLNYLNEGNIFCNLLKSNKSWLFQTYLLHFLFNEKTACRLQNTNK